MSQTMSYIVVLIVLGALLTIGFGQPNSSNGGHYLRYSRELLLSLRPVGLHSQPAAPHPPLAVELPLASESASDSERSHRQRKRGKRGGVRQRFRRQSTRPPLPCVILGNVRSLRSKMDDLHASVKYLNEYRESSMMCFTETWLDDTIDDQHVSVDGFGVPVRADRTGASGKTKGGGLCIYMNDRWCNNHVVRQTICTPDIELLSISCRPYYLPREFCQIFVVLVYVPPSANYEIAAETIQHHMHELDSVSSSAPKLILGDFNGCSLKTYLPTYKQYVTCATRNDKTIDLCYCNIKNAYKSVPKPPLGSSDHNIVQLLPAYKQLLKTGTVEEKTVTLWNDEGIEQLRGCFECTNWDCFYDSCSSLSELTDTVTEYMNFCMNMILPKKIVKIYPNEKPWMTKEVRLLLKAKKQAFQSGDRVKLKVAQSNLKAGVRRGKEEYKNKIQAQFKQNNSKQAWSSVKSILGCNKSNKCCSINNSADFPNKLNSFYCRFDTTDFGIETSRAIQQASLLPDHSFEISKHDVTSVFKNLKTNKASGPDKIRGKLLKVCYVQLSTVFQVLFQLCMELNEVPVQWKTAEIIPVPKKRGPASLNDYRPIALTSLLMKSFERILLKYMLPQVEHLLDPLQFAYRSKRSVEDATLSMLNVIYDHLDRPGSYARILFVDFSSAFLHDPTAPDD